MINKSNLIDNVKIGGMYLQKIYSNKNDDDLEDSLKLQGYTNSNSDIMSEVDHTYENSKLIRSLKMTNSGLYSYAKVLSNDELKRLDKVVETKIEQCYKNILDNKYDINPKVIGNINYGCRYCKYKDICFVKEEDKVILSPEIGGENNGMD